jgi:hypothetical protein
MRHEKQYSNEKKKTVIVFKSIGCLDSGRRGKKTDIFLMGALKSLPRLLRQYLLKFTAMGLTFPLPLVGSTFALRTLSRNMTRLIDE